MTLWKYWFRYFLIISLIFGCFTQIKSISIASEEDVSVNTNVNQDQSPTPSSLAGISQDTSSQPTPSDEINRELPKTGLPALAWVLGGLLPLGIGIKKLSEFSPHNLDKPNHIWQKKKYFTE